MYINKKHCYIILKRHYPSPYINIPRRPCPPHNVLGVMLTSVTQTNKSKLVIQIQ